MLSKGVHAMFDRFSPQARRIVILAQEEALGFDHNYIGTEHLLLGLLRDDDGVAARILADLGISLDAVRGRVGELIGRGTAAASGHIPFTPRARRVLEISFYESKDLGQNEIRPEHLLLGLVVEGEGVAAQVLRAMDADADRVRARVLESHGIPEAAPLLRDIGEDPEPAGSDDRANGSDDLEQRIAALERRVTELEQRLGGGREDADA
ncbi:MULTISPECIES: Clp protease N-terminal domain-containing protein [unclassified Nocardia]|uniref:Clp protease N-terminal domain-containing protein n=1 Tax=unclassified Nocardia TaxID=2637762 RepID=UPI0035E3ABCA